MPPPGTRALTLVVASAFFVESLVSTVIATSLVAMAQDLHVEAVTLKLAFTAYYVAIAVAVPLCGWLADRLGTRTVFVVSMVVFTLAGVLCALAWDFPSLIAGRFLQGLGGALMMPVGRLALIRTIPRDQLVAAMAWLSIPALMAPVLGPPLGGYITTFHHWRGIFWLGVPVGLLGALAALRWVPQQRAEQPDPLDGRGALLVGTGLALATFGFTLAGNDWHELVPGLSMMAVGIVLLLLYGRHARRVAHPVLDLALFRIPAFRAAIWAGAMFRLANGALPFLLPLMLQIGFGLSAFQSGMLTFVSALGAMTMKLAAAPILRRWGFRQVLTHNTWLIGAQMAAIALFTMDTPHTVIVAVLLVGGFFRSLQFTGLNALCFAEIPHALMPRATALNSVVQQLSLSAGVAVAALLVDLSRSFDARQALLATDFGRAIVAVAVIGCLALPWLWRLAPDAGAAVSGHRVAA
ncbi:MAG: MFS transporter [Aquabacterium sp.]